MLRHSWQCYFSIRINQSIKCHIAEAEPTCKLLLNKLQTELFAMCDQASLQVLVAHAGFGMLCVVKAQGTSLSLDLLQPFGGLCHCLHHWREGGPSMATQSLMKMKDWSNTELAVFAATLVYGLICEWKKTIELECLECRRVAGVTHQALASWSLSDIHWSCMSHVFWWFGFLAQEFIICCLFIVCSLGPELCLALQNKGFRLKALRMQLPRVGFRCRIKISKASSTFLRQGLPKGWWWVMLNKSDEFFICTLSF